MPKKIVGHGRRMQERNMGVEIKKKAQNVNKNMQKYEYRNYKYKKTTWEREKNVQWMQERKYKCYKI